MSKLHNGSKINQPAVDPDDQAPIRESQFYKYGQDAVGYLGSQKEIKKSKQQHNHEQNNENGKNPAGSSSNLKYSNQGPINQSQFQNQKRGYENQKIPEKEMAKNIGKSKESYLKNQLREQYDANNPYTPDGFLNKSKEKVKSVQSEEIVNNQLNQNSFTEKIASGIVIRVKFLQRQQQCFVPDKIYIEIRNQTNMNVQERQSKLSNTKKTKVVNRSNPVWDEDFYYNNSDVLDDNITFILRAENGNEIARRQERNLSRLRYVQRELDPEEKQIFTQTLKLQLKPKDKDQSNAQTALSLFIEVSFYEREDILGGIIMPNLSLKPNSDFVPRYNAVDKYQPNFTNKIGSKANCFNFFDGQTIPGFDTIEAFPPKYVKKNKHKKVIAAE